MIAGFWLLGRGGPGPDRNASPADRVDTRVGGAALARTCLLTLTLTFTLTLPSNTLAKPTPTPTFPTNVEGPLPARGEPAATLDLWRARPGADKIHVLARLPDGSDALFLVDTGAAVNVVSKELAERLGLQPRRVSGWVEGLSGAVPWQVATIPSVQLGPLTVKQLRVAVDVAGVPDRAGPLPVAGILGMELFAQFTTVIDDGADRLELWLPGTFDLPRATAPLILDGGHARTPVRACAKGKGAGPGPCADVLLDVDSGARDVLFMGAQAAALAAASTLGVEPIVGIGADLDSLPPERFLDTTRRVRLERLTWAGRTQQLVTRDHPEGQRARWVRPDGPAEARGGLLGWEAWAGRRLVLDVPGGRVAVLRSRKVRRTLDAVDAMLAQHTARHGDDPSHAAEAIRLLAALDRRDDAIAALTRALAARPQDAELASMQAWLLREDGRSAEALALLANLSPAELVEAGAWIAHVNELLDATSPARATPAEALARASSALEGADLSQRAAEAIHVAMSDVLLATGDARGAARSLRAAVAVGGSTHLVRSARVAQAEGDRIGALVALRELMLAYPLDGTAAWLRARLSEPADLETLRHDLAAQQARLHPEDIPHDFLGAAWILAGEASRGQALLVTGREADCAPLPRGPERENCEAWYTILSVAPSARARAFSPADRARLEAAEAQVASAYAERPSAGFADTWATALAALGDPRAPGVAALATTRMPGDAYLRWQLAHARGELP